MQINYNCFDTFSFFPECLDKASICMSSDTSMFVGTTARLFIVRYLIAYYSYHKSSTTIHLPHPLSWVLDILQQKLTMRSQDSFENSKEKIAVLDVIRMLLNENISIGQEILGSSKLFAKCFDVVGTADEKVSEKLVEVLSEILEKHRYTVKLYTFTPGVCVWYFLRITLFYPVYTHPKI